LENPVAKVLETGAIVGLANHTALISKDGTEYQIADSAAPIRDDNGQTTGVVLVFRDVTEEYRVAQALADSERDMARAQTMAQLGSWQFDLDTEIVSGSKQARIIYGVSEGDLTLDYVQSLPLPEYRPQLDAALKALVQDGTPYDIEFAIRNPADNTVRNVHSVAEYDAQHHRIVGTIQDITERKFAEEEIQRQLAEKETLLKEVHHRIKNNMAQVEGLLALQGESTDNREVQAALQEAISRVHSIRVVYDKLLIGKDYQDLSVKDYVESLVDSLVAVFAGTKNNISIEKKVTDFTLSSKKLIPVGIIISELLTNVFKYAFPERGEGHVLITVNKSDARATLTIEDDGVGLDDGVGDSGSTGFGVSVVQMLVEQLKGTYSVETGNGRRSIVEFEN
jgi:PAS domain S-box-containing protein